MGLVLPVLANFLNTAYNPSRSRQKASNFDAEQIFGKRYSHMWLLTRIARMFYTIGMMRVIDQTGNQHQLQGRLEKIVSVVIENAGDIVKSTNTQIIFDCSGSTVSASLKRPLETSNRPDA